MKFLEKVKRNKLAKSIVGLFICVAVGSVGFFIWQKVELEMQKVSNESFEKIVNSPQLQEASGSGTTVQFDDVTIQAKEQEQIWNDLHKMANTKIEATQIWGKIEITEELVNRKILEVTSSNFDDKQELLKILNNWKNRNFNNAVEEHNYLWDKLRGTIGRATALKSIGY